MKTFKHALFALALPVFMLVGESCQAASSLQTINAISQGEDSTLRLHFDGAVILPRSFMMKFPQMLVLDFPDTLSATGLRNKVIQSNIVKSVKFANASGKLRVMVSLKKNKKYTTKVVGHDVIVVFSDKATNVVNSLRAPVKPVVVQRKVVQPKAVPAISRSIEQARTKDANKIVMPLVKQTSVRHQAMANNYIQRPQPTPKAAPYRYEKAKAAEPANVIKRVKYVPQQYQARSAIHKLGRIDFRRENNGDGRVIIPMPTARVEATATKKGNHVSILFKNVYVDQASRRLNVLDFATPASHIDITRRGGNARVDITARTSFEFETRREGNNFIVVMKKIKRVKKKKNTVKGLLKPKKKVYKGKKLSLNFQDIEVRSVLQLLDDFTDKNIVLSDSVKGNITL
ncbi:MAG: AMIN domain-containing protein, partial [Cocleimonas sp.]|nr:AMIN domain-containing protein [Cocleimonas sp.]